MGSKTTYKCLELIVKISIGANVVDGPWGGGNLFFKNFIQYFRNLGNEVVNNLSHDDIDIILLTDPRKDSSSSSFTHIDIKNYLKFVNSDALVVHRINECDERKNTEGVNNFYLEANKYADETVFVSTWIYKIYQNLGIDSSTSTVILGGGDSNLFNTIGKEEWNQSNKIRLATHHWSSNINKGVDVYKKLDKILSKKNFKDLLQFTYIGNLSSNIKLKNMTLVAPLYGMELANELKSHHIYITASLNEPSGNHHIEAAQSGLPILYMDSGGIPEYCDGFGIKFTYENLEEKLLELIKDYKKYFENLKNYPVNNEKMMNEYENLFEKILNSKEEIKKRRTIAHKNNKFYRKIFLGYFKTKKILGL
jgi:glycosyltransferase involved in cell wall biosynthesis